MVAIIRKDLSSFFSSFLGLGIMTSFYMLMGIYLWWLDGNLLDYGFAELRVFFDLSPWFFLFFIPAISMRAFAEEFEMRTFDLLRSLPISMNSIVLGKLLSNLLLVMIILIPTGIFTYTISRLGSPVGNYDASLIIGAYVGLILLCAVFICLSTLASALVSKQSLAFVLGLVLNFVCWQGMQEVQAFETWSVFSHYQQLSKGVIDGSSILYFMGLCTLLFGLIRLRLDLKFT
jgi:ABC-2 type transport system permease protein